MPKKTFLIGITLAVVVLAIAIAFWLTLKSPGEKAQTESTQQSTIITEGSTPPNPDYFVSDRGDVIYRDNPSETPSDHNASFPPVFAGAQRIFPADDDPKLRESYLTSENLNTVRQWYEEYLDIRRDAEYMRTTTLAEDVAAVQSVELRDEDGRRQVALYVNQDEGPRGGMKVLMKEFPAQNAVQIILTTLDATPPGLNPFGYYASPEEVDQWAQDEAARQAELDRQRQEVENQADTQGTGGTGN